MFEPEIILTREQYERYYNERFIYGKELSDVLEIMERQDNYRILILGAPGSGKSTFLHQLSHSTASKKPIEIISGYAIFDNNFDLPKQKKEPVFVDGLDEMENPYGLLHFLNEKKCNKLVCTSRPNTSLNVYFTHIVTLKPTDEQIMLLIRKLGLGDRMLHSLMSNRHINDITVTPKKILSLVLGSINTSDAQEFYSNTAIFYINMGMELISVLILYTRKTKKLFHRKRLLKV